jgi:ribonuclease Z
MAMGLSGREKPLNLYSNQHCMDNMLDLLEAFTWDKWHSFPVNCITIPEEELSLIIDEDEFKVFSSPVRHFIPAIGIRVEFPEIGKILAYSGDTAPTPSLEGLAKDADVLIHETAGASIGHSSAAQAAILADKVNAKALYLVHYPVGGYDPQNLIDEAVEYFSGDLFVAEDFDELIF